MSAFRHCCNFNNVWLCRFFLPLGLTSAIVKMVDDDDMRWLLRMEKKIIWGFNKQVICYWMTDSQFFQRMSAVSYWTSVSSVSLFIGRNSMQLNKSTGGTSGSCIFLLGWPRRLAADEDQPWSAETYQRRELTPSVAILQNVSSVIFTGSH